MCCYSRHGHEPRMCYSFYSVLSMCKSSPHKSCIGIGIGIGIGIQPSKSYKTLVFTLVFMLVWPLLGRIPICHQYQYSLNPHLLTSLVKLVFYSKLRGIWWVSRGIRRVTSTSNSCKANMPLLITIIISLVVFSGTVQTFIIINKATFTWFHARSCREYLS